jgi:predicted membrane protein
MYLWVSIFTGVILFWASNISYEDFAKIPKLTLFLLGIMWLLTLVGAAIHVYYLLEGKKRIRDDARKEEEELEK